MKILFGGDACFAKLPEDFDYSAFDRVTEGIREVFRGVDYSLINLECVLPAGDTQPIPKIGPALFGAQASVGFLDALEIDAAGMANNHTGDRGFQAIRDTIALLREHKIAFPGAGENIEEAYKSHVFSKDGVSVAVIAVCENEFGVAKENAPGSAGFDLFRLTRRIREEKEKQHLPVIFFHGGNEENPFPSPYKIQLYRYFVDAGASAVIAAHTHCPQGYEYYQGAPIVYSMGNLYFPAAGKEDDSPWLYGYLAMLDFRKDGVKLEPVPYRFEADGSKLYALTESEREKFFAYLDELSAPLSDSHRIQELFSIWATIFGVRYAKHVNYSPEMLHDPALSIKLRNIFHCEAHNELIRVLTALCYEGSFEAYQKRQEEITRFQKICLN